MLASRRTILPSRMDVLSGVRRWILAVLVFGMLGTVTELLLLQHYEDWPQFIPLVLIASALVIVTWRAARPNVRNLRALHATMVLFLVSGLAGVAFHFDGAAEFQREIEPAQPRWELFKKVMRTEAPPVLAPGLMMQLGLLGLISTYHSPAVTNGTSRQKERHS